VTNENFTNSVRRGIRFRECAIQLYVVVVVVGGCCRETSSARASFSIEKPEKRIGENFKVTLSQRWRTRNQQYYLIFNTTFYIVIIIIGNEMIIGRYALIMTMYGKHNIHTRARAHTTKTVYNNNIIVDGRKLQATVNAADGPKRVRVPNKWSHCRRLRF